MKALSYLNKYFLKYKWRLLLGVLFIILSNYFAVQMPLFVNNTVDQLLNVDSLNGFNEAIVFSLTVGGLYMLLSIGKGFFLFLTRQTIIVTSRHIEYDLKNEIYAQYQRLTLSFYKRNSTGDLMNRISEDVSQVRMYLGPGVMYTVNLVVMTAMTIPAMISISGKLTFYVLLPLPLMSFLIYKVSNRMNQLSSVVQKQQSLISSFVQEVFSGVRVIKAYTQEKSKMHSFDKEADIYKRKQMNLVMVNALFMPTIIFLIGISTIVAIYLGGLMTYRGEMTPGQIIAAIMYVNYLTWPFASVGWVTSVIQRAAASQERINEFLSEKPEIENPTDEKFELVGPIEFRNVTFTYPNSQIKAVENLNFVIEPGQTVGIIGKTGSGKSTILNLLMRQVDPDRGEILINGQNLKEINLDTFRRATAVVPQEVFLFSDSIRQNVAFGVSDGHEVTDAEVVNATKRAHVLHNIESFPDAFETLLGERGVNLSGGQKQRLSIARALLRDADLLILDDCFSAVDTHTEEIILRNLKSDIKQKTSIIVSHRISSLRNADVILVLDQHTIVERGTHKQLMKAGGLYAEMYERQLAEEEKTIPED